MKRRHFIQLAVGLSGCSVMLPSCSRKQTIRGGIIGASAHIGHMLRDKAFESPTSVIQKDVVIVGAGVSGLSAAYHLKKAGIENFVLLDLEEKAGGNAAYGKNEVSGFPWGAHYVPVPNNSLTEYLSFLKECNVVTGYNEQGLPVYNELFLCFDPEDRLYINGQWQEGLVPHFGVPEVDKKQIREFLSLMNDFRYKTGSDGKDAFALPVALSSKDEAFVELDKLTMKEWLLQQGFTSSYLHWYVNYCTRDDFGTPHDIVSAWAGIHYYACRKGKGANAGYQEVLTWPEGNGWLVQRLEKNINEHIHTWALVTKVKNDGEKVLINYFDVKDQKLKSVEAKQCIMAVPQFIAGRLLDDQQRMQKVQQQLHYVPWMVANLTVQYLEERSGAPLSWDNVIYESDSLGYVNATQQLVDQYIPKKNLTYYLPLTGGLASAERKAAQNKSYEQWVEKVMGDLKRIHPNIEKVTEELNVQLWGHAMVQPLPGMIHGQLREALSVSLDHRIHFAHTDLAGVSLFEEGFYQGLYAAKKVQNVLL